MDERYRRKYQGLTKQDFISELQRVSDILNSTTVSEHEFKKHSNIHPSKLIIKFGSWNNAIKEAGLTTKRQMFKSYSDDEIKADLNRVSRVLSTKRFTFTEYKKYGKLSIKVFTTRFDSIAEAFEYFGFEHKSTKYGTKAELFDKIEQTWIKLGRQPTLTEVGKEFKYNAVSTARVFCGSVTQCLREFCESKQTEKPKIITNKGEVFNSITEACEKTGSDNSHITKCLKGKRNHHNNRTWNYLDYNFKPRYHCKYLTKKQIILDMQKTKEVIGDKKLTRERFSSINSYDYQVVERLFGWNQIKKEANIN